MAILINKSAPADYKLRNKTITLKGFNEITILEDADYKALLKAYPSVKRFIDAGFITEGNKVDNSKGDDQLAKEKAEAERVAKAKADAEKTVFETEVAALVKGGMKQEDAVAKVTADMEAEKKK